MSTPPLPAPPCLTHAQSLPGLPLWIAGPPDTRLARAQLFLKTVWEQVAAFHREGAAGISTCRMLTASMDLLVRGLFEELRLALGAPQGVALLALGSYGRRELSPHSDLDLLLLLSPDVSEEEAAPLARALPTLLWDLKRAVGWSVRSPEECALAAEQDHTVRTSLLDGRLLAGSPAVHAQLFEQVLPELLNHRAASFIQDKREELRARRVRFGDSVFLLEPHLKQGEGGLRDLETALWMAQARFRTRGITGLLQASVLPVAEVSRMREARDFLLRIRHQLHFLRGRKEDRLTFDLQEEVARFLGYPDTEQALPVEAFMRHYYLAASVLRRAADGLIARCEEGSLVADPSEKSWAPFQLIGGKLGFASGTSLMEQPALILDFFRKAEEEKRALFSAAQEQVGEALPALAAARDTPAVTEALKALWALPLSRGLHLFEFHESGALAAVMPEFGRVTALHQHDLYHVYTVDIHLLFALKRLYALRAGDLAEEAPELTREMQSLADPLPLYLGTLMHDAGKGSGGDHSERGRALMAQVGERLRLSPRQREISEFLVLAHLLMSRTAQRRDLSDPDLIAEFARQVGDVEKLTCLYLLTYADICSVGPQRWTAWKGLLLKELFDKTRAHLLGPLPSAEASPAQVKRQRMHEQWRQSFGDARAARILSLLPERYFLSADPKRAFLHGRLLERGQKVPFCAALRYEAGSDHSELCLVAPDQPGLLALFAGVLSAHRIDILSARIVSTQDGMALDVFDVRPPRGGGLERSRWKAARADLLRLLAHPEQLTPLLERRRPSALLQKSLPRVPAKVTVDNQASQECTVVDVRAQDRVGLLYVIASALNRAGLRITLAKVATEAHRAVDSFYGVNAQGQKLTQPAQLKALVQEVRAALERFELEQR